jgi:diguanylate cyclase (GGDEF)-like protein/PAS domain S-box-containing protein
MSQDFRIAKCRPDIGPAIDLDERHFRHAADFLPAPVVYCDRSLTFRYANPTAAQWLGKPLEKIIGHPMSEVLIPGRPELSAPRHKSVLDGKNLTLEETRLCGDGKIRHVRLDYVPDFDDGGNVVGFFVLLTDLTKQRNAEAKATHTYQQLKLIVDAVPAMIAYCDRDSRYVVVNQTMADWFHTDTGDLIGKTPWDLYGREMADEIAPGVTKVLSGQRVDYECTRQYPNGQARVVNTTLIPDTDSDGIVIGYFVMVTDITERKLAEEKLTTLAYKDSLTGVTNRHRFAEVCADEIARSQRYQHPLSLAVCDLDHFKCVNDNHGHDVGDIVLKEFSNICVEVARHQIDRVARLGGEEFVILLPETSMDGARILAERLRQQCDEHVFDAMQNALRVTVSIGITEWRQDETNMEAALKRADVALYTAKNDGRNRVVAG